MRRWAIILAVILLWVGFGWGVNQFIASHRNAGVRAADTLLPDASTSAPHLNGILYLAQGGNIYRLENGRFSKLSLPRNSGYWLQPAIVPGTSEIIAVFRANQYSDLYLIDGNQGTVLRQLTHNAASSKVVQANHWVFNPTLSRDGSTIFSAYDSPKVPGNFLVDLAIWAGNPQGKIFSARWSTPNDWTGGDVDPSSDGNSGVIYAKYQLTGNENIASQLIWRQSSDQDGIYLTTVEQDCTSPAVSPDGKYVAAVCSGGPGYTRIAEFSLATAASAKRGVSEIDLTPKYLTPDCICASPSWSPDGKTLAFLAPQSADGHFQLWSVSDPTGPSPGGPNRLTDHLDFDAISAPAWSA